ncbi:MAG: 1-phosphofructokinase family hexose kinase [Candidatus Ventricola sp.]
MIHVLCLNPAIDKLYRIDGFTAGEDYPGQRPVTRIGGKGVNVARVLSQLGERVRLVAFVGEESMAAFRREMEPRCDCAFLPVAGACRTTVNVIDRQKGRETVITEAGPQATPERTAALLARLDESISPGDFVCCSGSVIAGAPADIYARVSRLCAERGARCALDCNAGTLPPSLANARYALGKPNERELCALLGAPRTQEPAALAALAHRLMPPYDALLVSMGARGGLWAQAGRAYLARVPQVPVRSSVGSGDASLAGALLALSRGMEPPEALRMAMACGAANAVLGEVGSVRPEEVQGLMARITTQAIDDPITEGETNP